MCDNKFTSVLTKILIFEQAFDKAELNFGSRQETCTETAYEYVRSGDDILFFCFNFLLKNQCIAPGVRPQVCCCLTLCACVMLAR